MDSTNSIKLSDMLESLSKAVDLISPEISGHHKRVAYISSMIAKQMGLPSDRISNITVAAALHDIGALSMKERVKILNFDEESLSIHAEIGYKFLKLFSPVAHIAPIVRYHHVFWGDIKDDKFNGNEVPIESCILHLADRIDILIMKYNSNLEVKYTNKQVQVLTFSDEVIDIIQSQRGKMFHPEAVDAFIKIAQIEAFWLYASSDLDNLLKRLDEFDKYLDYEELLEIARWFSQIIDFRNEFTAVHSEGVSATSEELAKIAGMNSIECKKMKVAGYLHDLGKLAVPTEILDKPGKLNYEERKIVNCHTFFTFTLLDNVSGLEDINAWASFHHEKLSGNGYPFHISSFSLPLGARVLAAADILTAITEDRPYRKAMAKDEAVKVLDSFVQDGTLDKDIVKLIVNNYAQIDSVRKKAQDSSRVEFQKFWDK